MKAKIACYKVKAPLSCIRHLQSKSTTSSLVYTRAYSWETERREQMGWVFFFFLSTYSSDYGKADHSTEVMICQKPAATGYGPQDTRNKPWEQTNWKYICLNFVTSYDHYLLWWVAVLPKPRSFRIPSLLRKFRWSWQKKNSRLPIHKTCVLPPSDGLICFCNLFCIVYSKNTHNRLTTGASLIGYFNRNESKSTSVFYKVGLRELGALSLD